MAINLPDSPVALPYASPDEAQHLGVLIEAYNLFRNKSTFRGDLWRQYPPSDKVRELKERVSRLETAQNAMHLIGREEVGRATMREDAIDIINFATFLVKQLDEGAIG